MIRLSAFVSEIRIFLLGLIAEMKTYKLVDQCLFHTELALKYLNYIDVEEVRL